MGGADPTVGTERRCTLDHVTWISNIYEHLPEGRSVAAPHPRTDTTHLTELNPP